MKRSMVISISGPSGAGKSTLMEKTVETLGDAESFYFDAYQATLQYPEDLFARLQAGEFVDPSEIKNDSFIRDLRNLINGTTVIDPWGRTIQPAQTIVVEEPFGRLREGMSELIDVSVSIDIPLEISLSRRIIRNLTYDYINDSTEDRLAKVLQYVSDYNLYEGKVMRFLQQTVNAHSDVLLDGLKPLEVLVDELATHIKQSR
jgi:uridine kinase